MIGKILAKIKKPWDYIRSHLWIMLFGSVAVLLLMVMVIFQSYLKGQYYNYLLSETEKLEQTTMNSMVHDMNNTLGAAVYVASEVSINSSLRVDAALAAEDRSYVTGNYIDLIDELSTLVHLSDSMVAMTIAAEDGVLFDYGRYWYSSKYASLWAGDNQEKLTAMFENLSEKLKSGSARRYLVETTPACHEDFPNVQLFHVAMPLVTGSGNSEMQVMVVITYRLDSMVSGALSKDDESGLVGYLTNSSGTIFYHQDSAYEGYDLADYQNEMQDVFMEEQLEYFDWTVHLDIDTRSMTARVNRVYRTDLILYIIMLLLVILVWQFLLRRVLRTIDSISEAMEDIQSGNPERQIPIEGSHELWALAGQYNDMVTELQAQREETRRNYRQTIESIEERNYAERMALESQIDAHFLCNTLTALHYDALDSGNTNLSVLLKQLSEMLHYTLSTKQEFTTVGMEIKWAREYLDLQKFRRMDLFDYEIHFPEVYSEWPCCKQFFQPFIENSIVHGFEKMTSGGRIVLSGEAEAGCLRIELYDNGCGMPKEVKDSIEKVLEGKSDGMVISRTDSGYGISNVVVRLRMFYGSGLKISLVTAEGQGSRFIFRLPIPESMDDEIAGEEGMEEEDDEL